LLYLRKGEEEGRLLTALALAVQKVQ